MYDAPAIQLAEGGGPEAIILLYIYLYIPVYICPHI